jgi:hypothetical protein
MEANVSAPRPQLAVRSFDGPLGRNIIETHIWAVREGLRGASAYDLFDGYCQRLVIHGVPLWRVHAAMETLHPQWGQKRVFDCPQQFQNPAETLTYRPHLSLPVSTRLPMLIGHLLDTDRKPPSEGGIRGPHHRRCEPERPRRA